MIFKRNILKQKADLEASLKEVNAEILRRESDTKNVRFLIKDGQILQFKITKETKKSFFVVKEGFDTPQPILKEGIFTTLDEAKAEVEKQVEELSEKLKQMKETLKKV